MTASMDSGPSQSEVHNLMGMFSAHRYEEAEAGARTMIQAWPNHALGWKALGAVLASGQRRTEAAAALEKVVELMPSDAEAHNNLGNALQAICRPEEAVRCYRRALALSPDYEVAPSIPEMG